MSFRRSQLAMDIDHGDLDHVGGGALDGGVDGVALGGAADGVVGGADVADITAPAGDGLDVAVLPSERDRVVHVLPDAGELREILVDDLGGFLARNAQALGQAEGGDAVGDAVIDHLGLAAHLGRDHFGEDAEDPRGGGGVDVDAGFERFQQARLAAERGDDAQLDLRVIRREQQILVAAGTKALRISWPRSVRMGMFCRFGSCELSRPVVVITWL